MKKLLIFALAALAALTLRAGEEEAVKKVFTTINELGCELKFSSALRHYTEDFEAVSASGKKITKAEAVKLAAFMDQIAKGDASITEIWTAIASMQGRTPDAAELAQIREMEKTPEGRQRLQMVRDQMKAMCESFKQKAREQAATFRFISVRTEGNRAVAVYQEKDFETGKTIEHTCQLLKQDGKWLIRRDNGKFVEAK